MTTEYVEFVDKSISIEAALPSVRGGNAGLFAITVLRAGTNEVLCLTSIIIVFCLVCSFTICKYDVTPPAAPASIP